MSYESECDDYAVHVDDFDYEDNALLDRFDGWTDYDYAVDAADDEQCPVCGNHEDCDDCKAAAALLADEEKADCDDILF